MTEKNGSVIVEAWSDSYRLFFSKAACDPYIRTGHLAVFSALLFMVLCGSKKGIVRATSKQVMEVAKISSQITYLRIIADLARLGYIEYRASLSKYYPSKIKILGFGPGLNSNKSNVEQGKKRRAGGGYRPANSKKRPGAIQAPAAG